MQTVLEFLFVGEESSTAVWAEWCDAHFTSRERLDAASSTVPVFDV